MRVAAFVILCCALQHITSEIIDERFHNILNDINKYETKNETTSDEFGINQNTGEVEETLTTHKEFLLKNGCGSDLEEGDIKIMEFVFKKDEKGRERIYEEDTIIKKIPGTTVKGNDGIPVTSCSSSSASAASQTPQRNSSVATGSAASASTAASSNAGSGGIATEAGARGAASGKSAAVAAADNNGRAYKNKYGLTSIDRPNDHQGPQIIIQNISSSSSSTATSVERENISGARGPTTGDKTIEVTPAINAEPGPQASIINDNEGSLATSYSAASAASGPSGSGTTAGSAARTHTVSKPAGTAPGEGPTYLDFNGPGYNGENDYRPQKLVSIINNNEGSLATSYSAASAASGPSGSGTTAGNAARTHTVSKPAGTAPGEGPTYLDFNGPGYNGENDYRPQKLVSIINNNEGSLATSYSAASAASGPSGSGTTAGSAARTHTVSKPAGTAPGEGPTYLDFYGPGYNGENDYRPQKLVSIINNNEGSLATSYSAASAASGPSGSGTTAGSAARTHTVSKPAGTAPGEGPTYLDFYGPGYNGENDYRPQKLVSIFNNNEGSLATSYSAASAASGPSGSGTTAGSAARTHTVSKPAGTAPGEGPTYLNFYGPDYNGENDYRPQKLVSIMNNNGGSLATSYSAASAASGPSRSGTTAGSAVRTQGPASGSTSTESSSGSSSDTGGPERISGIQESSGGSEEGGAYRNGLGRGGAYKPYGNQRPKVVHFYKTKEPGSGSSGSPGNSPTKIVDKTAGTQRPESGPVSKPAGSAPGEGPTYLDFYGPGYNGENYYRPQKLVSIINNNEGSLATSYSAASAASGPSGSGTTAGSAARTHTVSKPAGTAPGEGPTYLDFNGPGYNGENDYRPQKLVSIINNNEGSLATSYSAASAASGPSGSGTTAGSAARTHTVSKPAGTAPGEGPTYLDFYGPGYNGENDYRPQKLVSIINNNEGSLATSYSAASAASGPSGSGTTAGSAARTHTVSKPAGTAAGEGPTYLDFNGPGYNGENDYRPQKLVSIINNNEGSLATSYSAASAASGPSGSGTTAGSAARTHTVSKPAGTAPGEGPTYLDFNGPGYTGENDYRPQKLVSIINNNEGSLATSYSAASAASGPSGSGTTAGSAARTHTVSKPAGTAPGEGPTYLNFYGPDYNGENDYRPQKLVSIINNNGGSLATSYSAASAASGPSRSGTTAGSAVRTQGPASGSTSTESSSGSSSDTGGPERISGIQESSGGSEEGGAYRNGLGRGGAYKPYGNQRPKVVHFYKTKEPGSGSSGSPGNSPTKIVDKTAGTQRPESGPVSKPAGTAPGEGPTYLDFYGPGYNGENDYRPQKLVSIINNNEGSLATSYSAASAASGPSGSGTTAGSAARTHTVSKPAGTAPGEGPTYLDFNGPGYNGENDYRPQKLVSIINNNEGSLATSYSAASAASGPSGSGTTAGSAARTHTVSKPAGTAPGEGPTYLDFYGPGSNGENYYRPQKLVSIINNNEGSLATSYSAASAASGPSGSGTTAGSAARTHTVSKPAGTAPGEGPTYLDFNGPGYNGENDYRPQKLVSIINNNEGSLATSYSAASAASGPSGSGTTAGSAARTHTVSKPAGTAPGEGPTYLDFYGPGYNGENDYRPQKLVSIINNNEGSLATSYSAASAASGPSGSGTTAGSAARTHTVSKPARTAPGEGPTYLDFNGPGYNGENDYRPQKLVSITNNNGGSLATSYSAASAASGSSRSGTTAGSAARTHTVSKPAGTAPGEGPTYLDFYGPGYNGENDYRPQKLVSIINNNEGSLATSYSAASAASGPSGSGTTAGSAARTHTVSKPAGTAPGEGPTYLDFNGPGYNGENDYRPQKLVSIINNNEGSLATSYSAASAASGPSGSGTTAGSAARTHTVSKPAGTAPGEGPTYLDFYGPGYNGENDYRPQKLVSIINNNEGSLATSYSAASAASGPSGSGTTAGSAARTHTVSKPAGTAAGEGPTYLDFNGPGYNGENDYRPQKLVSIINNNEGSLATSYSAASAASGPSGSGTTAGSAARTHTVSKPAGTAPGEGPTYLDFNGPGYTGENDYRPQKLVSIINNNEGSLATSYSAASAASGPSGSGTTAGSAARTHTVSKPAGTAPGEGPTYLDFYGPGYNGENDYRPQKLVSIINNNEGSLATSYSAASAASGPSGSGTTAGSAARTHTVSKPAGTAPGEGPTYLDFNGPGYNGENDYRPQKLVSITNNNGGSLATSYSAASAASGSSRSGTTAGSAARTQGPASGSTSTQSSSGSSSDTGGPGCISGKQGSSGGSEEGGLYENGCRRGIPDRPSAIQRPKVVQIHNTNRPDSGSSGTPGASPTTKEGVSGTRRPVSVPASRPVDSITINNQNELRPDSYRPGYYGQDYLAPQEVLIIEDNAGGSETNTNIPELGSSGTPGASPTTKEGVSGTQRPGSGRAFRPVGSITGNNRNELGPDSYEPGYYGQDYSIIEELTTINDNECGSESSSSPAARAPAGESAAGIPDAAPTTSGVASGDISGPGRKRVRQACRLKSSQFVLRLGRKGQPCTFCY